MNSSKFDPDPPFGSQQINANPNAAFSGQPCFDPTINIQQQSVYCHSNGDSCSRPAQKCSIYGVCWMLVIFINFAAIIITVLTSMPAFIPIIIVFLVIGIFVNFFTLMFFSCGHGVGSAFYLVCGSILTLWHFGMGIILFLYASNAVKLNLINDLSNTGAIVVGILHLLNIINFCVVGVAMFRIYRGDFEPRLPIIRNIRVERNLP